MSASTMYDAMLLFGGVAAAAVFISLFRVDAPYGRYARSGWGAGLPSRWGWVLMELPAVLATPVFLYIASGGQAGYAFAFLALWELHYLHRTFVFPFFIRESKRRTPWAVVGMAAGFNVYNGYVNGWYLGAHADAYAAAWFTGPCFLVGAAIFLIGMAINLHADYTLIGLRKPGQTEYTIPAGGLYRWISCPNYFGEIIEWIGWAILTWSPGGAMFAVWTIANLAPRAYRHHAWYRAQFPHYPAERRALIPGVF